MKLLNQSLLYVTLVMFFIIGIWAVIFYVNLKDEIRDSIDDGLENNKLLILQKVRVDSTLLLQNEFGGNNFEIHEISKQQSFQIKDKYKDTLMYRQNEDDLEPVRILHSAFEYDARYYRLNVISSLVEEDDLIEDSFWSVFWLFIILIVSLVIINNIVFRKIWKPFYEILNRLKTYRLDKSETTIKVQTNTKEFIQLQDASNALLLHSKETYTSQKQFTENASHEIQTPFAIIISKLELLLESDDLQEKEGKTIVEVINISERLKKLNNSLLLLAKIENNQFLEQKIISIYEVSQYFLSSYRDFINYKNIDFKIDGDDSLQVSMNFSLLETLISNLIKNAIFHNKENGNVSIRITKKEFTICNSGKSTALNPEIIFNRFEKDASNGKSTGLGLAICQAICKSYGIHLTYHFKENKHCFAINFDNCKVSN